MMFLISLGLFTAAVSMSLIAYKREYKQETLRLSGHQKKTSTPVEFSKGDQLLYEQKHWTILEIDFAHDGIKWISIAHLDETDLVWMTLIHKDQKIINGFYRENKKIKNKRGFTDSFSIEKNHYKFKFKTRMASHSGSKYLWGDAKSINIRVYEDQKQKCFFVQISRDEISWYFQGDNLAADKVMFLSTI